MSGEGTMRYTTGDVFSGEWSQGRWNGKLTVLRRVASRSESIHSIMV